MASSDDFPTPELLREANAGYKQKTTTKDSDGRVVPSPAAFIKQQIFNLSDYELIDAKACQVRIVTIMSGVGYRTNGIIIIYCSPVPDIFKNHFPNRATRLRAFSWGGGGK